MMNDERWTMNDGYDYDGDDFGDGWWWLMMNDEWCMMDDELWMLMIFVVTFYHWLWTMVGDPWRCWWSSVWMMIMMLTLIDDKRWWNWGRCCWLMDGEWMMRGGDYNGAWWMVIGAWGMFHNEWILLMMTDEFIMIGHDDDDHDDDEYWFGWRANAEIWIVHDEW